MDVLTVWTVDVDVALHYPIGVHRTHRATVLAANATDAECAAAQMVACRRDDEHPLHRIAMPVATRIVDWPAG